MWSLISLSVRIAAVGYILYKVWQFLIAERCGGYWKRLFSAERLERKRLQRQQQLPPSSPQTQTGNDPVSVVGSSKTVYISSTAKPQTDNIPEAESGPKTEPEAQPNADAEQQTVASTRLEREDSQSNNDDGFNSDGIETTILPLVGSDYVDEEDLPPAAEHNPGEETMGLLIEDIEMTAEVIKKAVRGEDNEAKAADTLYVISQNGVVEYEQAVEQMQEKVVSLMEKFGYPPGIFTRWTNEEFRSTVFG